MNFFSSLCLVHPPQKLSTLRGHYTEGNTLFARSGTKQLSDFHFKIDFNKIFFQQADVYFETINQILKVTQNNQTSTVLVLTSNENYRFQLLKEIILQVEQDQRVYLLDYRLLRTNRMEDTDEIDEEAEDLQELTFQNLNILHSQIKHRKSMNSVNISLKISGKEKEFTLNILQVNLMTSNETENIHKQFKLLFEEGVIDEEEYGARSKELNESSNIFLLTYLTFEEKKRIEEECYLEFLSRIKYSSEVHKLKESKKAQNLITQLTLLRQNKDKLNQEIGFYQKTKKELNELIGEELIIIRKHNIKFTEIGEYKEKLKTGMSKKLKQIELLKQKLTKLQSSHQKTDSSTSSASNLLTTMRKKLNQKLQLLCNTPYEGSKTESRMDLNQSVFSKSTTYTRPRSALRTHYLDMSKSIITKENSKVKSLVQQLEMEERNLIEMKKQEMNTLPELAELYGLMRQMGQNSRGRFVLKHNL